MSCRDDYNKLQNLLVILTEKVAETQGSLGKIAEHLKVAKVVTDKSAVFGTSGAPLAFLPNFEANSEVFRIAVEEVTSALLMACEHVCSIEEATEQIVVGVNKQIDTVSTSSPRRHSMAQPLPKVSSNLTAMTEAIARLNNTLEQRRRGGS